MSFSKRALPSNALVKNVQQAPRDRHGIAVGGTDAFPPVPGRVGCRKIKHGNKAAPLRGTAAALSRAALSL